MGRIAAGWDIEWLEPWVEREREWGSWLVGGVAKFTDNPCDYDLKVLKKYVSQRTYLAGSRWLTRSADGHLLRRPSLAHRTAQVHVRQWE